MVNLKAGKWNREGMDQRWKQDEFIFLSSFDLWTIWMFHIIKVEFNQKENDEKKQMIEVKKIETNESKWVSHWQCNIHIIISNDTWMQLSMYF